MEDVDSIATGLATIEMLDEVDETWASFVAAHADAKSAVLGRLEALLDALSDGTRLRARYRLDLRALIEAIEKLDELDLEIPGQIVAAAHLCHVPIPLGEPNEPGRDPRVPPSRPYWEALDQIFNWIQTAIDDLVASAPEIRVGFIIDKNGQLIGAAGDTEQIDTTSLAALTAGELGGSRGMWAPLRERAVTVRFPPDEPGNAIHIELVDERVILCVVFDEQLDTRSLRRRTGKAVDTLLQCIAEALFTFEVWAIPPERQPFEKMTKEDIDNLFNH